MTRYPSSPLDSLTQPAAGQAAGKVVQCWKLTKTFRDFWMRPKARAVDAIDLEIRQGEIFGLLGPNGSGKSTTIKMILGLLKPTSGRVSVLGRMPDDVATKKRIGYLPEESYLYRFLSARETLDYYGRLFHLDARQRAGRIDMLLEMVGLEAMARRPVGEFSKGMQRRIGLAQALINDPDFLILDEPTTGLDPIGTKQIKDLIVELGRRGKTILLCSHLLSDVEDVCDRVAIMFGGRVQAMGTVDELLTRQDCTTIQTSPLDEATLAEVRQLLDRHGKPVQSVEHPRMRLETLFLQIVQQAQAQGLQTSGARNSGQIAAFLQSTALASSDDAAVTDEVIASLSAAPVPAPMPSPSAADSPASTASAIHPARVAANTPPEEAPDQTFLQSLSSSPPPPPNSPPNFPPNFPPNSPAMSSPAASMPAIADASAIKTHFEAPPSEAERQTMDQLGNRWGEAHEPTAAPTPIAAACPVTETPASSSTDPTEETPDSDFLKALTETPYDSSADKPPKA